MRRLRSHEELALKFIDQEGPHCIGEVDSEAKHVLMDTLLALLKLKLVLAEESDDGPVFWLSPSGRERLATLD